MLEPNLPTVEVFFAMLTQWRVGGMGGAVGLDYAALPAVMRYCGVKRKHEQEVFNGVRTMESEVLSIWRAKDES